MTTKDKIVCNNVKLNLLIFKEVSYYLIYNIIYNSNNNDNFKEILEHSLLSKSTFKIFQNLLKSYDMNKYKFILSCDQLLKYISNDEDDKDKYQYKLIQYKEIERIKLSSLNDNDNEMVKRELNKYCSSLKKIVILDRFINQPKISKDFTIDGFFKVKKLTMYWEYLYFKPYSIEENEEEDDDQTLLPFSFNYLLKYNPKKIYVNSIREDYNPVFSQKSLDDTNEMHLDICTLDNILTNGSLDTIRSIKFQCHNTGFGFIKKAIKSNKIESFTVRIGNFETFGYFGESILNQLLIRSLLKGDIKSNTKLRKFIIRECYNNNDTKVTNCRKKLKDPAELLKLLALNESITTLGLDAYRITKSSLLIPLLQMSNIKTLYCDSKSLKSHLEHCNENNNITKLHFTNLSPFLCYDIKPSDEIEYEQLKTPLVLTSQELTIHFQNHIEEFTNFFNNNESSLNSIIISTYDCNGNQNSPTEYFKDQLNQSLLNSKSSAKLNLRFKDQDDVSFFYDYQ